MGPGRLAIKAAACVVYHLRDLDDAGRVGLRHARRAGIAAPSRDAEYLLRRNAGDLPSLFEIWITSMKTRWSRNAD